MMKSGPEGSQLPGGDFLWIITSISAGNSHLLLTYSVLHWNGKILDKILFSPEILELELIFGPNLKLWSNKSECKKGAD